MTLPELIAALEQATGPSRESDAEIAEFVGVPLPEKIWDGKIVLRWSDAEQCFLAPLGGMRMRYEHPPYTASIDAARKLMPDGLPWMVRQSQPWDAYHPYCAAYVQRSEYDSCDGMASTPAIALCIAALKAREEKK